MTIVDNIDERARIIYDYVYNHNEKNYKKYSISLQNINKDDIKVSDTKFWINNILNNNISFIKNINNIFFFKRTSNNLSMNILLYPLDDNNLDNLHSQNNMNAVMSYILSELSVNHKTRHLLLNLLNMDLDSSDIKNFLIKFPEIDATELLKYKKIGMSVTEHYFKIMTLDEILKGNTFTDEKYQVLFFQILHTLAVIQKEYPDFRHNQLHPNKIYCYFKNKQNNYSFENIIFNVPDIGFDIKLYHYDKSNIYSRWDNQDLTDKEKIVNKSYDWLSFINTLDNKKLPPKTKEFVNEMLKLNINKESVIPINLILSHNYFNSLRKNISNNNNIMKDKINHTNTTTLSSDSSNSSDDEKIIKGVRKINLQRLKKISVNEITKKTSKRSSKKSSKSKSNKKYSKSKRSSKNKKTSKKSNYATVDSLDEISSDELKEINENNKKEKNENKSLNINNLGNVLGIDSNYFNKLGMPNMDANQMASGMGMPGMDANQMAPGMGMSGMGMPGMDANQMAPGMGMSGMGMPGMGMSGMGMPGMGMSGMGMSGMGMPGMEMAGVDANQMASSMGMSGMDANQMAPGMGMADMGIPGMDTNKMASSMGMPGMDANKMASSMGIPGMNANQTGGNKNNFFFIKNSKQVVN
jgi:hypothetical protein